jgi:molecular chaperone DnaK
MAQTVGIDLGTTFSAVGAIDDKTHKPYIIPNSHGKSLTPSVIYFDRGEPIVGDEAKEMQGLGMEVAAFFKRSMGDPNFALSFCGKEFSPVDLSSILLTKLKEDAESALGKQVEGAVITVPAYFNNHQREATIKAGEKAGLKVLRIINEPTAAALAYGVGQGSSEQKVLVFDLGGGTFDVTLVKITSSSIDVIATDGDHELGGKDWDDRIVTYLGRKFLEEYGVDPLDDNESFHDILVRCENAKKQLSIRERSRVSISYSGEKGAYEISRPEFEEITRDLMERTRSLTEAVLGDAGLPWVALAGVLLVGGSTRMPMVCKFVEEMSGKKPITGVNVDEAVALGAAIQAQTDSQPNTPSARFFTLTGTKNIRDVMGHSLGMVAENGDRSKYVNSIIIPKNKPIPCSETKPFSFRTAKNRENQLEVYMLQGESEVPVECVILGKYRFTNITHIPGKPSIIDIRYAYDKNGMVTVSATEKSTGKELPLTVEPPPEDKKWLSEPPPVAKVISIHLSVLIAVDLSGSMSGKPLQEAQKAARKFVGEIDLTHASIGLIGFADTVKITQSLSQNARKLYKGIDEWTNWMDVGTVGWGNDAEPFTEALFILKKVEDPRFVIVLTDGQWSYQDKAIMQAKLCHKSELEIIAIGFGQADKDFLKAIATSDSNALFTDLGGLVESFSNIAQVLTETSGGMTLSESGGPKKKSGFLGLFK